MRIHGLDVLGGSGVKSSCLWRTFRVRASILSCGWRGRGWGLDTRARCSGGRWQRGPMLVLGRHEFWDVHDPEWAIVIDLRDERFAWPAERACTAFTFPVRFHLAGHRDIGAAVYSVGGRVGRRQSLVATRQMLG